MKPTPQLNNDKDTCRDGTYFLFLGQSAKISLEIYGQTAIFGAFVRKQNAFYGQTIIFR